MQEIHEGCRPEPEPDNLDQLGDKLKELPEGWTFETKVLDEDLLLDTCRAGGWAAILRDDLGCSYQGCGYGARQQRQLRSPEPARTAAAPPEPQRRRKR